MFLSSFATTMTPDENQQNNRFLRRFTAIATFLLGFPVTQFANTVDFVRDVRPIFEEHCYDCHGAEKQKSGLRLDIKSEAFKGGIDFAPAIVPGQANESPLIQFVRGEEEDLLMPPKGDRLSAAEIKTLTTWVNEGAVWPDGVDLAKLEDKRDHWSFKPIAKLGGSPTIDSLILARLSENGLSMSPEADRLTWLRRVFFDLIGLPPTPEQIAAFQDDQTAGAHEKIVDSLLSSPRYGERWAQHWLDVVRYADTHGFEVNTPRPNAWPYRDYVISAFNNDTPYDQFIREQLAGDAMGQDAATGFLVTSAVLLPGQIGKDEESKRLARQDELGEIVINTGEAFLGLSIGCARCHDHKFDPISAKDYYSMQAFFAGVEYGDRPIHRPGAEAKLAEMRAKLGPIDKALADLVPLANSGIERAPVNAKANTERFAPVKTKRLRFVINSTNQYEACIDELEVFDVGGANIALASRGTIPTASGSTEQPNRHELKQINDGSYGNSRSWMLKGATGWVELEFPEEFEIERVVWGRDREEKYKDRLPLDYRIEVAGSDGEWKAVAGSTDRKPFDPEQKIVPDFDPAQKEHAEQLLAQKTAQEAEIKKFVDAQRVYAGKFKTPEPMHLLHRGDPEQPQEEVMPAVLTTLGNISLPKEATDQERRLALAAWITKPENPLTARVMVNRIWQGHFGIGLVESTNDFGWAGAKPTHPELLDWLATEFIRSGWSIKHMHRLIVLTATYRQSSQFNSAAQAKDGDVRLLWRFPARRLEAETIRDTMLEVSGRLNLKAGGPGFDLFKSRGGLSGFPPIESFSGDGLRRMIYAHKIRMERESVFGAFDCPDAGQSVSRRRQSTTPIQALNLFNSRFTIEESAAFANRIEAEAGAESPNQVRRAYQISLGRDPDSDELADAISVVNEHGLATLCRALFNSSEFLFLP
ncbi:MAG: hypothetical protein ACI8UO_003996 [Verrucomicrobiales bacterium]|jgi:hypothetical protein